MRGASEYEITREGEDAVVTLYGIRYAEGNKVRVPQERAVSAVPAVVELLEACRVARWDGFHGAHPKGVTDGIMFDFSASVNDGRVIRAEGSQNFPPRFHEFREGLNRLLRAEE